MPTNLSNKQWKAITFISITAVASRILYYIGIELCADEAYYWLESKHLAAGYFDNGPLAAFLAAPVSSLQGELALRFLFVIVGTLPVMFAALIARELTDDPDAPIWAAILCAVAPMLVLMGGVALSDSPHVAAYSAATWLLLRANQKTWLWAGLTWGLAMLAKWNSFLLVPAMILAAGRDKTLRSQFRTSWVYLGLFIGLLVFSPFVIWNWQHDWIAFRFQYGHATNSQSKNHLLPFCLYFVSLLTGAGPIAISALPAVFAKNIPSDKSSAWTRITMLTMFPLVAMAYLAATGKVEYNWPAMCFPSLLAAVAAFLSPRGRVARIAMSISAVLCLVLVMVLAFELRTPRFLSAKFIPLSRLHGWRDEALALSEYKNCYVIASNYQIAAQLAYYGHFRRFGPTFDRPSQFDIWAKPERDEKDCVIVSFRPLTPVEVSKFCRKPESSSRVLTTSFAGQPIRKLWVYTTSNKAKN